jgi:hypothetical protein
MTGRVYAYHVVGQPGRYYLKGNRTSDTYHHRQQYKTAGAEWDGTHWTVDDDQRRALGIERMVRVKGVHSCGHEEIELVPESLAIVGTTISVFCGWCDGRGSMRIDEIPA